jgi:hypothetical protein
VFGDIRQHIVQPVLGPDMSAYLRLALVLAHADEVINGRADVHF